MATNIEHIENGEQGLSVRQKINDLIDLAKTNQQSIIDLIAGGSGSKEKYCFKGIVSALDVPEQVTHDKEFYIGVFDWEEQTFENFLDPDGNKISVKGGVVPLFMWDKELNGWLWEKLAYIPQKISELENDKEFVTKNESLVLGTTQGTAYDGAKGMALERKVTALENKDINVNVSNKNAYLTRNLKSVGTINGIDLMVRLPNCSFWYETPLTVDASSSQTDIRWNTGATGYECNATWNDYLIVQVPEAVTIANSTARIVTGRQDILPDGARLEGLPILSQGTTIILQCTGANGSKWKFRGILPKEEQISSNSNSNKYDVDIVNLPAIQANQSIDIISPFRVIGSVAFYQIKAAEKRNVGIEYSIYTSSDGLFEGIRIEPNEDIEINTIECRITGIAR